ncbi:PREDICTED: UPF0481 protein At3g47200-like [Brassica oleracea var. oleracea]|uniref:Uncharacterized protein n=1 Tax=Brassica oleracea var. oleracea TaxID=109376 RepID=A0A0D3BWX5_BRAOL|nr:PREDICTED: UPF0481 protein At3g47200-like [Brassica oleracea var. oleracea]XP_013636353.1 PREDICTED: UPF0481 protein At3g47200-like [Brassica oleracea var. oleracea]XP_013636354.1 PREDICTED: UPF0481 protein At3g47200-like [Brassica oleracea var. oleracea]
MDVNQPREMYPGMWRYPMNPEFCCIYRVPNRLREVNPEPYTPQLVLIGPLHHSVKSQALKALYLGDDITYTKSMAYLDMEEHKKTYLAEFAARIEGETTIDELRRMIKEEEETIRASYQESTAWIQSPEFVEMVLHDSVFIIEFILRFSGVVDKNGDPLLAGLSLGITVYYDLILLENQLPFFILEKLFNPIVTRIWPHLTFRDLIIIFFGFQGKIRRSSKFKHFTDLIRCVRVETLPNLDVWKSKSKPIKHMYNADKLDSGGVKFKAVGDELSLCVSFKNGCLKIPCLTVDDSLEMKLRNIMALEQCHYPNNARVCSYALFLDYLIDTDKDVDLLLEKGILKSWIRQPAKVAQMVNKLVTGIVDTGSYYHDIAGEVNEYYRNLVNRSKAILKRVYFGNPWTGTATIAATFLLVMTLIQTWASIVQVKENEP